MTLLFKNLLRFGFIIALGICGAGYINISNKAIKDFSLKNVDGKTISTKDYPNAKGFIVVFTCNHCPFAKLYSTRLNNLSSTYSALDVPLIAINSMDTLIYPDECFEKMQTKAKHDRFNFAYLQDETQKIGKMFGAEHTPTAFVIWKVNNEWLIKYRGCIDDNGEQAAKANPFIAKAVNELLEGKIVSRPVTDSFGCRIFYRN